MGVLDISVRYDDLKRASNGNVTGKITLRVSGSVLGKDYDIPIDARNFDFPRGGEQKVYDQEFGVEVLGLEIKVHVLATVHEHTAGQCCVQGRAEGKVGVTIGKDLDPNCAAIPEA